MTESPAAPDRPESSKANRRWRDDPLSVFLAVAALLLGAMYYLEQRSRTTILDAAADAQSFATSLDVDGCVPGSASRHGRELVLVCETRDVTDVASTVMSRWPSAANFDEVAFVDQRHVLRCEVGDSWPDECERIDRPTAGDVAGAPRGGRPQ